MLNIISIILQIILSAVAIVGFLYAMFKWVTNLNNLNKNVTDILSEVKPNGGQSLKDKVNGIETKMDRNTNNINAIYSRQKWMLDNRPEPIFECDVTGSCTWVNEKYCQLLQHDVDYFLGNGWKNGVYREDLETVEKEWDKALKDQRSSVSQHRVMDRAGNIYKVKVVATRDNSYGYIGHIQVLEEIKK